MIEAIIIASLVCTAIHVATMEGMIWFWVRVVGDMYLPLTLRKPLYECLPCMASIWGTLIVAIMLEDQGIYLHKVFIAILAVSGLNTIIANAIRQKEDDSSSTSDRFDEPWGV